MASHDFPNIEAIIVMGVSGSGKSTIGAALAAELGFAFEDGDRFHSSSNIAKMKAGVALTDADRRPWLDAIAEDLDRKIASRIPAVVACSALKRIYRDRLLGGHEKHVRLVYLHATRDVLLDRLSHRNQHFMTPEMLDGQLQTLEPPAPEENAISVDVSGTVDQTVASIAGAIKNPR